MPDVSALDTGYSSFKRPCGQIQGWTDANFYEAWIETTFDGILRSLAMSTASLDCVEGERLMTKLTCLPKSLCLWDYRVLGTACGTAAVNFNFLTEQGIIELGDRIYTVRKHGWLSGRWSVECDEQTFAEAQKPNPLFRSFEVTAGEARLTVKAGNPFGRSYEMLADDALVGTIKPVHLLTRRAVVECKPEVPEIAMLFSFWLAVVTWRRQAKNND